MNINASIKKQYLEQIIKGAKTTEYREMTEYWTQKLVDVESYKGKDVAEIIEGLQTGKLELHPRPIKQMTFYCERKKGAIYKVTDIRAYKGHKLFAIGLGKRVE